MNYGEIILNEVLDDVSKMNVEMYNELYKDVNNIEKIKIINIDKEAGIK